MLVLFTLHFPRSILSISAQEVKLERFYTIIHPVIHSKILKTVKSQSLISTPTSRLKSVASEGKRFTVLHAGGRSRFLGGCELFLDSNIDTRDYHKTMNGELLKQWTEKQIIPSIKLLHSKVVVVLDYPPYHSVLVERPPSLSWTKSKSQFCLQDNKIPFESNFTKKPSTKKFEIDELLFKNGIKVLRLPPYYCHYDPTHNLLIKNTRPRTQKYKQVTSESKKVTLHEHDWGRKTSRFITAG